MEKKAIINNPATGQGDNRKVPSLPVDTEWPETPSECVQPTNGSESPGSRERRSRPVAAVLQVECKMIIGLTDEEGMPAGPFNAQPVMLSRLDPEKRGRTIEEQFAELCRKAVAQVVEQWEAQRAG